MKNSVDVLCERAIIADVDWIYQVFRYCLDQENKKIYLKCLIIYLFVVEWDVDGGQGADRK